MVVAARMLAVAVRDKSDECRILVLPFEEDEVAAGAGEGMLNWFWHRDWHSFRSDPPVRFRWYLLFGYWNGIRITFEESQGAEDL